MEELEDKRIVVFASGGAPASEEITSKIRIGNFTSEELKSIEFFYFQSGLNYEKMGFSDRAIMKVYSKLLELKTNKSDIEDGTSNAILTSYDHSSREYVKPLVAHLQGLLET